MRKAMIAVMAVILLASCTITKNGKRVIDVKAPSVNLGSKK